MTAPHRRVRTGTRRDGQIRSIDSSAVRYPGLDHPAAPPEYETWKSGGRQLMPARDTGLAVEGRLARERRLRERRRRRNTALALVAAAALLVGAFAWQRSSDARASQEPLPEASVPGTSTPVAQRTGAADPSVGQLRAMDPAAHPTPIFASYGSLQLRLPVRAADLTEVGFHQASYAYALDLDTPLTKADGAQAKRDKGTQRDLSQQDDAPDAVLVGEYISMWRNRPGKPDTAVDVGADPGATVFSPVSGTIVKVKRYKLYGIHDDYEIHIQPRGYSKIDVVMIHISDVVVKPGDAVQAGVTHIGLIRKLSDKETLQLGEYTRGGGNHTHMQLNDASDPNYKGLKGAIKVSRS